MEEAGLDEGSGGDRKVEGRDRESRGGGKQSCT